MKVTKSMGQWLDKKTLKTGDIAKLVSEATEIEGQNGMQLVAKLRIKGQEEAKNISINAQTKNALIDAFGDDTNDWCEKLLTAHVERTLIAGKRGTALYLIPEGYAVREDENGYLIIAPSEKSDGSPNTSAPWNKEEPSEEIKPEDIPF